MSGKTNRKKLAKPDPTAQRYHVRIQFNGGFIFVCPVCGYINHFMVRRGQWMVRCKGSCQAKFIPRMGLLHVPAGTRTRPADTYVPDANGPTTIQEAFPQGDYERWVRGGCVHWYQGQGGQKAASASASDVDVKELVKDAIKQFADELSFKIGSGVLALKAIEQTLSDWEVS